MSVQLKVLVFSITVFIFSLLFCTYLLYRSDSIQDAPFLNFTLIRTGILQPLMQVKRAFDPKAKFNNNTITFDTYRKIDSQFIADHGYGYIQLFNQQVESGLFRNPEVRPYRFIGFFKTSINGELYYILVEEWLNKNGTIVYLPFILKANVFNNGTDKVDKVKQYLDSFPSPLFIINNIESCNKILGSGMEYCTWYLKNTSKYIEIYNYILNYKNIPIEISKYPILLVPSGLYVKNI